MIILILFKSFIQQLTITSCSKCDYYTVNFEPFMALSLEIPDSDSNLYDCLSSYTNKTTLDADNLWTCDKCKQKVNPDKKIKLWKTSNVIIILLKRYSNRSKKNNFVEFPLVLDLDDYLVDYEKKGKTYSLSGNMYSKWFTWWMTLLCYVSKRFRWKMERIQ